MRHGTWAALRQLALPLRIEVFVQEQGVPEDIEEDEFDALAQHVVICTNLGHAIATGRLLPDGRIGRLAVRRDYRACGFGKLIMTELMAIAQKLGYEHLVLHARCEAQGFYESYGFKVIGEPFLEAGSPHILMQR